MKHKNDKGLPGKVSILTASKFSSLVKRCSSICQQVSFLPQSIRSKFGSFDSRGSHRRCSVKKGVLRNFSKLTGRYLCQSLFFNKVAGFRPATLLKKRLWCRCFPVNFEKFLRTDLLQNTSGRLLLWLYWRWCVRIVEIFRVNCRRTSWGNWISIEKLLRNIKWISMVYSTKSCYHKSLKEIILLPISCFLKLQILKLCKVSRWYKWYQKSVN